MDMTKVNGTRVHAVYKKIEVLHYIRFAADSSIFDLLM